MLNPQTSTEAMIERFHREAITAQIGHEGIAQVTDIGTSGDGEPFLVMEYLEGESLASRLMVSGPLAIEDACELGCAILSPLAAAHRAGIVHRDLKPDNVFLVRQSRGEMVKLLDPSSRSAPPRPHRGPGTHTGRTGRAVRAGRTADHLGQRRAPPGGVGPAAGGALLMSSGTSPIDPAIEFTTPRSMPPQVIQLSLHAYLASGADQTIRIYRNSRQDLLFTSPLTATHRVDHAVVVDALPGDRFLVAISGTEAASEVGLQFHVNATGQPFPSSCQLALSFTGVDTTTTTTVQDPCSKYTSTSFVFTAQSPMPTAMPVPFMQDPGPYPEQKPGIFVGQGMFLRRDGPSPMNALDWSHDITVQLWTKPTMLGSIDSFLFADFDVDSCGGVALSVRATGGIDPRLTLHGCTDPVTKSEADVTPAFPMDSGWHFVRVVRTAAGFDLCIDGAHVANLPVQPGAVLSTNPPVLGKPVVDDEGASYVGGFDDVRAFAGALPCR